MCQSRESFAPASKVLTTGNAISRSTERDTTPEVRFRVEWD